MAGIKVARIFILFTIRKKKKKKHNNIIKSIASVIKNHSYSTTTKIAEVNFKLVSKKLVLEDIMKLKVRCLYKAIGSHYVLES